ncbi:MAG: 2-oxoacid:acceptor oxidoreductase family protein [Burkholderiales bacterium]|nr:MAG: 2-oxoacid:acceptor oxidoreductase family protein [Burkholderiales bacterium]
MSATDPGVAAAAGAVASARQGGVTGGADASRTGRTEIRIAGTGGQGLILAATMLADALASDGRRVAQSQTYEPTSRGGFCNSDLVASDGEVDYPLATALDHLVLLDRQAVVPSWPLLKPGALVIADTRLCPELPEGDCRAVHLPLTRTAIELGSERVANIVALGALVALSGLCDRDAMEGAVRSETPRAFLDLNMDALAAGERLARQATA